VVSALVAAEVDFLLVDAAIAAVLAGLATIAAGVQKDGRYGARAKHHYERMDTYDFVSGRAQSLKGQVQGNTITLEAGWSKLEELEVAASKRPEMP
jgi:hypothetical protein